MKKPFTLFSSLLISLTLCVAIPVRGQTLLYKKSATHDLSKTGIKGVDLPVRLFRRLNIEKLSKPKSYKTSKVTNTYIDTVTVYANLSNTLRISYHYDTSYNNILALSEEYSNGTWQNSSKDTLVYDSAGNVLSSTWKNWSSNTWVNASRTLSTYGTSHILLTQKDQTWQNGAWDNSDSSTYSYDLNDNVLTYYKMVWNDSAWVNKAFRLYTYDSLGRMTAGYYQSWADTLWINDQRYLYDYDTAGNVSSATLQKADLQEWKNYYKEIYTHDPAGHETGYTSMFWNDTDSVWTNSEKYTYTYDAAGNVSTAIGQDWNDTVWINSQKGDYSYDTYGGVQSALTQYWSVSDSAWVDTTLSIYNYDNYGDAIMGDFYTGTSQSWNQNNDGVLTIPYDFNLQSNYYTGYHVDAHFIISGQNEPEGVKNFLQNSVKLFTCNPNPVSGQATLSIGLKKKITGTIDLYDLSGRKIQTLFQGTLNSGEQQITFNMTSRKPGIYLVALISGKGNETIKLIKR